MHIVTFTALADFPALLEAHLRAFPFDVMRSMPVDGAEAKGLRQLVVDQLVSIQAFELTFQAQLTNTLSGETPASFTSAAELANTNDAVASEPEAMLADIQDARKRTLSILEDLTEAQWSAAIALDGTDTTVIGLVHRLCAHDFDQLSALQHALANCGAA